MKAGNNNTEKQTVAGRRSCRDRSVYRKRAQELVARMTTEEKVGLMSGLDTWHTKPVERLGIPSVMFSDGPHGLRKQLDQGDNLGIGESVPAVCFPAAVTMACTFDPKLVSRVGQAMGEECLQEQVSVILGPGINHKRDPRCGRNFEYYSEDPVVSGTLGSAMVRGIQSTGVGASLKHFAANNQEKRRMTIDARIDEQTLREIYLKAFNQVVKEASPMTVMCSYNRLDGEYNSENRELLTTILREEWEYDGTVISDWGAVHDRTQGIQAGLDLEMPGNQGYNDRKVLRDLQKGKLSMEALDLAAERVTAMALECMEAQQPGFQYDAKEHHALAKKCAEKGAVLLKNNGILPACPGESTAILGEMAEKPRFQGAGSSKIHPLWIDTPLEAIREQIPGAEYAPGYRLEKDNDDGEELLCNALEAASRSERVFLFAGLPERYESEGFDREDLRIPENQIRLIRETAKVNPRLTVILMGGAPMEMEWEDEVPSILLLYLGGEACGAAAADLLMGKVNPSGKLAETWPMHLEDVPSYENFPGNEGTVEYREGIWTGYRYYDRARKPVRFSFGHGLSYTKFCYRSIEADRRELSENGGIKITVTLQNTGKLEGEETVFLFSSHRSDAVFHPEKELRGFQKIRLRPGETGSVEFTLSSEDLAFYNTAIHNWYAEPGKYILRAGGSSEDLPLSLELTLTTKKRPVEDRRRDVPFYYGDLKDMHVPDDQFAALYGKTLPAPVTRIRRPYGPEHTLENARHNLFGKILLKYVDHLAAKVSQEEEGQEGMMAAAMKEMPLFALVASGEDMFPEHMMNAVLNLLNGHYWNAIQCVLKRPPQ